MKKQILDILLAMYGPNIANESTARQIEGVMKTAGRHWCSDNCECKTIKKTAKEQILEKICDVSQAGEHTKEYKFAAKKLAEVLADIYSKLENNKDF